jgi:hypothetical protein
MVQPMAVQRIKVGLFLGLCVGALFASIVGVQIVFRGTDWLLERGLHPAPVLVGYLLGGAVGGVIIGLLAPMGRTWYGAALLGFVVAVPVFYVMVPVAEPPGGGAVGLTRAVLELSLYMGPVIGLGVWAGLRSQRSREKGLPGRRRRRKGMS